MLLKYSIGCVLDTSVSLNYYVYSGLYAWIKDVKYLQLVSAA